LKQPHSRQLPPIILFDSVKVPSLQTIKKGHDDGNGRHTTDRRVAYRPGGEHGIAPRCNDLVRCAQGALSHRGRCVKDRHVTARPGADSEPSLFAAIVNPLYSRRGLINSEMDFEILLAVMCPGKL
jgi:hypothetical protein